MKKKFKVGDFVRIINPTRLNGEDRFYTRGKGKIAKIIEDDRSGCPYRVEFIEDLGRVCSVYDDRELEIVTKEDAFLEWL